MKNGSIADALAAVKRNERPSFWTETNISVILVGLVFGLKYIHSKEVIHRDIKPSNLLIDDKFRIRIADFGTVRVGDSTASTTGVVGTFAYMAPEAMEPHHVPTKKVDVFSLGLVLYEVLVGESVFPKDSSVLQIVKMHLDGWRPALPKSVHPVVREVIEKCWAKDPDARPTVDEVFERLSDNWFPFHRGASNTVISEYISELERATR
jgi:serine/threonine protein kinase